MSVAKYNIEIDQGSDFALSLTWNSSVGPVNLTGYQAKFQVRQNINTSPIITVQSFGSGYTPNTSILLGGVAGTITINLAASVTNTLTLPPGYQYGLLLMSPGGLYTRLVEGLVVVKEALFTW